jgi:ATP-binding cassette, subfamily B, bacterial
MSDPESSRPASMWSRLRPLLGDRRRSVVALATVSVLSGLTEAGVLAVVAQVAASLVGGATHVTANIGPLHAHATVGALLAAAAVLSVVRLVLQVPVSVLPARIAADVWARLGKNMFDAFTHASWAVQSRDREGHVQEMMSNQLAQAIMGALQAANFVTAVLTFLVLILSALALNVVAALAVLVVAVLLFGLLRPLNAFGQRRSRALSQAQMDYAGGIGEAVRVAEETQVFGVGAAQRDRIGDLVGTTRGLFFRTQLMGRLIPNLYQSLIFLIIVAGLAGLYATGGGHVASLGAVVLLLVRAGTYGQQVQGSYQFVRQALPFVDRLREAEQRYVASRVATEERPLLMIRTLALDDVSYSYRPGRPVLSHITFEIEGGEAIGIIGPSGAGKSTLVQILLQLRTPDHGCYRVNGEPVKRFALDDWHRRVAYVPQEPRLLHASVTDNIRYFRSLDDDAVDRAAKLARIHDDIMDWSDGYDTMIGPRADAISGGQQQRICLARALVAKPDIIVLDEPTSALDPHSEALLQDSLSSLTGEVTLFIVAHRMSTLEICGRVMVIADGRLEAFDTVALLQRNNSYYRSALTLAAGTSGRGSL